MEKYAVFKAPSNKYFVSVRMNNRTVFGGTFDNRLKAEKKARSLLMSKPGTKPKRIVCMY